MSLISDVTDAYIYAELREMGVEQIHIEDDRMRRAWRVVASKGAWVRFEDFVNQNDLLDDPVLPVVEMLGRLRAKFAGVEKSIILQPSAVGSGWPGEDPPFYADEAFQLAVPYAEALVAPEVEAWERGHEEREQSRKTAVQKQIDEANALCERDAERQHWPTSQAIPASFQKPSQNDYEIQGILQRALRCINPGWHLQMISREVIDYGGARRIIFEVLIK